MFKIFKKPKKSIKSKIFLHSHSQSSIKFIEKLLADLTKWKFFAIVLLVFCAYVVAKKNNLTPQSSFIATLEIDSIITTDSFRTKVLADLNENKNLKGVFVKINTPGGTITGSEILYNELKTLSAKVPVYALIYDLGASGGYMIALGATKIFAHQTSMTGSIGVLMQTLEAHKLAEKIGAKYKTYRSVKFKAQPDSFTETSPEIDHYMQSAINESHKFFQNLVQIERKIPKNKIANIANGKIFTGQEALNLGLIDAISNEKDVKEEIVALLKEKHNKEFKFKEISLKEEEKESFISQIINEIFQTNTENLSKKQILAIMN